VPRVLGPRKRRNSGASQILAKSRENQGGAQEGARAPNECPVHWLPCRTFLLQSWGRIKRKNRLHSELKGGQVGSYGITTAVADRMGAKQEEGRHPRRAIKKTSCTGA